MHRYPTSRLSLSTRILPGLLAVVAVLFGLLSPGARAEIADRADRTLSPYFVVSHAEPGVDRDTVAHELAEHLRELADFLALDQIHVGPAGDLAAALGGAVAASSGAVARRVLDQVETQTPRLVKIDVADRLLAGGVAVDQHADAPVE